MIMDVLRKDIGRQRAKRIKKKTSCRLLSERAIEELHHLPQGSQRSAMSGENLAFPHWPIGVLWPSATPKISSHTKEQQDATGVKSKSESK